MKDAALLMTSADDFFWTFEQAVSYYQFAIVNYIGFTDKGMLLAGGCGDTNGKPNIRSTAHLKSAYELEKTSIIMTNYYLAVTKVAVIFLSMFTDLAVYKIGTQYSIWLFPSLSDSSPYFAKIIFCGFV